MLMKKTALYIIPGLGESTRSKNYRGIIKYARDIGLEIVPVNINWSSKMDMTDFIAQVDSKIPDSIDDSYVLGFSFGAYITAVLAKKKNAKGYIFCSASPYFKENLKDIPEKTRKYFGETMFESFKKYSFPKDVESEAWFLIGEND